MAESMQDEVQQVGSGASLTYPMQVSGLRKGGYAMLKNGEHPCKLIEIKVSKVGKHGHAKAHIVGIDIFTEKRYEENHPSSHNIDVPHVSRKEYLIINIEGDDLELLTDKGEVINVKFDEKSCNYPKSMKELKDVIDNGVSHNATVVSAMGQDKVKEIKKSNDQSEP